MDVAMQERLEREAEERQRREEEERRHAEEEVGFVGWFGCGLTAKSKSEFIAGAAQNG